jgi:hypothetical protein
MHQLNDNQLINCYLEAIHLKLDNKFLNLLLTEINKRNLGSVLDTSKYVKSTESVDVRVIAQRMHPQHGDDK